MLSEATAGSGAEEPALSLPKGPLSPQSCVWCFIIPIANARDNEVGGCLDAPTMLSRIFQECGDSLEYFARKPLIRYGARHSQGAD